MASISFLRWARAQALIRNAHFLADLEQLISTEGTPEYDSKKTAFLSKWSLREIPAVQYFRRVYKIPYPGKPPDAPAYDKIDRAAGYRSRPAGPLVRVSNTEAFTVKLEVDLRYSDRKILQAIKQALPRWREISRIIVREELFEAYCQAHGIELDTLGGVYATRHQLAAWSEQHEGAFEQLVDDYVSGPLEGGTTMRLRNPEDYAKFFKVWDLRKSGMSWSEIAAEISPATQIDDVRNWHSYAERLISKGVPGLPVFPSELSQI